MWVVDSADRWLVVGAEDMLQAMQATEERRGIQERNIVELAEAESTRPLSPTAPAGIHCVALKGTGSTAIKQVTIMKILCSAMPVHWLN